MSKVDKDKKVEYRKQKSTVNPEVWKKYQEYCDESKTLRRQTKFTVEEFENPLTKASRKIELLRFLESYITKLRNPDLTGNDYFDADTRKSSSEILAKVLETIPDKIKEMLFSE